MGGERYGDQYEYFGGGSGQGGEVVTTRLTLDGRSTDASGRNAAHSFGRA